jgi:hypothetical protein
MAPRVAQRSSCRLAARSQSSTSTSSAGLRGGLPFGPVAPRRDACCRPRPDRWAARPSRRGRRRSQSARSSVYSVRARSTTSNAVPGADSLFSSTLASREVERLALSPRPPRPRAARASARDSRRASPVAAYSSTSTPAADTRVSGVSTRRARSAIASGRARRARAPARARRTPAAGPASRGTTRPAPPRGAPAPRPRRDRGASRRPLPRRRARPSETSKRDSARSASPRFGVISMTLWSSVIGLGRVAEDLLFERRPLLDHLGLVFTLRPDRRAARTASADRPCGRSRAAARRAPAMVSVSVGFTRADRCTSRRPRRACRARGRTPRRA